MLRMMLRMMLRIKKYGTICSMKQKKFFLDMGVDDAGRAVRGMNQSAYRLKQLLKWVYKRKADDFEKCSDLPAEFRKYLSDNFTLRTMTVARRSESALDGTVRYTFALGDGENVSAVYMPGKDRNTVCLSTQVGCPVGCSFCASGKVKFRRNLSPGEILEQVFRISGEENTGIDSILFMGMGEPLLNYRNVVSALKAMTDAGRMGMSRRSIVISTIGLVQKIKRLAGDDSIAVRLALSLHAPSDSIRAKLIPARMHHTVKDILDAGLRYGRKSRSRLTVEYILVAGINDTAECAKKLYYLISGSMKKRDRIQVNLIPFNAAGIKGFSAPPDETVRAFSKYLSSRGILTTVRRSRGADIGAACGQLTA